MRPLPNGLVEVDTDAGPVAMAPYMAEQYASQMPAMPAPPTLAEAGATAGLGDMGGGPDAGMADYVRSVASQPEVPRGIAAPAPVQSHSAPAPVNPLDMPYPQASADPSTLAAPAGSPGATPQQPQSYAQKLAQAALEGGPRSYYVAPREAGFKDAQRTVTTTAPMSAETQAALTDAQRAEYEAAQKQAQAQAAISDETAATAQLQAEQATTMVQAEQARRAAKDARLADLLKKRDELTAAIPEKIDPNRWDRAGGAGRVLAAFSIALSGIGQALGAGDNGARAMLSGIVRDDIDAQKAEIAMAQRSADKADNQLQYYTELYEDPILGEKQLEIEGYGALMEQAKARISAAKSDADKAASEQLLAQLQAQQALAREEFAGRAGQVTTAQVYDPGRAGGMVTESLGAYVDRAAKLGETGAKLDKLTGQGDPYEGLTDRGRSDAIARQVQLPEGGKAWAKDKESATKAIASLTAAEEFRNNLRELREIAARSGSKLSVEDRKRVDAIAAVNTPLLRDLWELGAITKSDQELMSPQTGEGILGLTTWTDAQINGLEVAERVIDAKMETVRRNLYADPMGQSSIGSVSERGLGGARQ